MRAQGLILELPGKPEKTFTHLFLDFTGTLSADGRLLPGVAERLDRLAALLQVCVLTADTFGTAVEQLRSHPVEVRIIQTGVDKADVVQSIGGDRVIAVGNGRNDLPMIRCAGLGIAVIGPEGAYAELFHAADIVVCDAPAALDLLLHPQRLKATLRE